MRSLHSFCTASSGGNSVSSVGGSMFSALVSVNQPLIVEHPLDPGRLIPPHIHYREDELSYVVRGEIGVRIGDRDYVAGPGSYESAGKVTHKVLASTVPNWLGHDFVSRFRVQGDRLIIVTEGAMLLSGVKVDHVELVWQRIPTASVER